MTRHYFYIIPTMNITCVTFMVLCCLLGLSVHTKAVGDTSALTVVHTDEDGGVALENENGNTDIVSDQYEPFHPTNEWQIVKEGQAIPAGLHVRMNFETGVKEAKLMDNAAEFKYWRDGDRHGMMNMDKKQFSMNELKKALKDFKTTQLDDTDLQREGDVKKNFKSYEELKKDFASMNMDIKTDSEIIQELLAKLKAPDIPREDLITVLTDLEYYLHQIDNGILFKDIGGIPHILKIMNKSMDEELQIEAALVLGAATSSNPKVQISALEAGALRLLLHLMSGKSSLALKRKVVYCLSALIRHFPFAQKRFLELGGLVALGNVFDEPGFEKVKVKIMSFLNDLLTEKVLTVENANLDKTTDSEKLKQYNQVMLLEAMIEQGWCERLPGLLQLPDHDSREHVLNTMLSLASACKTTFMHSLNDLEALKSEYIQLGLDDEEDDYFASIVSLISSILSKIRVKEDL